MNESILIRQARAGDGPQLASLFTALGYPTPPAVIEERLRAFLAAGEAAFVAVRDDTLVGALTVHMTPVLHRPAAVGRLSAVVVTEQVRGQGMGAALVQAAERYLASRGCGLVEVTSNWARTRAHAFYEQLGYEPTSIRFKKDLSQGASA